MKLEHIGETESKESDVLSFLAQCWERWHRRGKQWQCSAKRKVATRLLADDCMSHRVLVTLQPLWEVQNSVVTAKTNYFPGPVYVIPLLHFLCTLSLIIVW